MAHRSAHRAARPAYRRPPSQLASPPRPQPAAADQARGRAPARSFRPGQPTYVGSLGHRRRSGPATSGVCAGGAAGPAAVLAAHRADAAWPRARWPGRLALAAARRAARAVCRRRGCAAAASRSSSPGGVRGDLAGRAAGVSRRPGTRARCLAARAWRRPHPPLVRAPCPGRCPRPGPGGMRYLAGN